VEIRRIIFTRKMGILENRNGLEQVYLGNKHTTTFKRDSILHARGSNFSALRKIISIVYLF